MKLLIDQGNTRLKWLLLNEIDSQRFHGVFDYSSNTWETFAQQLLAQSPDVHRKLQKIAVATVAGEEQLSLLKQFAEQYFKQSVWVARTERKWRSLKNSYQDVSKMGVDRWLACIGAEVLRPATTKIVVDAGSAITVECLAEDGLHLGGYIGPGLRLLQSSLLGGTANIQAQVQVSGDQLKPGRNTQDAVSAAALQMGVGLIKGALQEIQSLSPSPQDPEILFTGGDGKLLHSFFANSLYVPHLVLDGLEARCD